MQTPDVSRVEHGFMEAVRRKNTTVLQHPMVVGWGPGLLINPQNELMTRPKACPYHRIEGSVIRNTITTIAQKKKKKKKNGAPLGEGV